MLKESSSKIDESAHVEDPVDASPTDEVSGGPELAESTPSQELSEDVPQTENIAQTDAASITGIIDVPVGISAVDEDDDDDDL